LIATAEASTVFVCSYTSSKGYYLSGKIHLSHHQTRTSCTVHITYNKQTENRKSGQTCRITSSHACLAMYVQTNVRLPCCVGSGSSVAATLLMNNVCAMTFLYCHLFLLSVLQCRDSPRSSPPDIANSLLVSSTLLYLAATRSPPYVFPSQSSSSHRSSSMEFFIQYFLIFYNYPLRPAHFNLINLICNSFKTFPEFAVII
jgi:hypothetical protein